MEEFLKFLANPTVQIIGWTLGGIGWILGIVSAWLQIKSYRQQSKLEQGYLAILEQAKRDWHGKYTEEQIESMTKELKRLDESIRNDVPQKARQVFLEDQLLTIEESVAQGYNRYKEILAELKGQNQKLPDPIQYAIEHEIMPKYMEQQMRQKTVLAMLGLLGIVLLLINFDFFFYFNIVFLYYFLGILCFMISINYSFERQLNRFVNENGRKVTLITSTFIVIIAIPIWFLIPAIKIYFMIFSDPNGMLLDIVRWFIECPLSAVAILFYFRSRRI